LVIRGGDRGRAGAAPDRNYSVRTLDIAAWPSIPPKSFGVSQGGVTGGERGAIGLRGASLEVGIL